MEELKKQLEKLLQQIEFSISKLGIIELEKERDTLKQEMARPDFWQDNTKAQAVSKKEAELTRRIEPWLKLKRGAEGMVELAQDESLVEDLKVELSSLSGQFEELKKELRFQGPYDDHSVILSIYAGAGGTDAQDWAEMLLRMYTRWAESHKLKVKMIDHSAGEEAGIKSATLEISGADYLYGKLKGEHGVHRLVRQSPFNSAASRETSFAKVDVLPVIDQPNEVDLDEKDLKIDVFRAGGHGGQSVNTTDSAVRITHLPTGITVAIQNERSQLQNKETALTILRSRLAALQLEQHTESLAELKGPNQSAEWGNQIRSYVLHPYKQVKDTRTGYETSDPQKILDGNIDPMLESYLS
jgi:peptide chain release factor 2